MSRYIDADKIEYHEDNAVYRHEINAMPTADVRENVIAEWEVYNYDEDAYDIYGNESFVVWYRCRNCGFIHAFMDSHTEQYNFCPKCGHIIKIIRREKSNNG